MIDIKEAERHLALNGIGPNDPVILWGASRQVV
jgi:hypothetical protein